MPIVNCLDCGVAFKVKQSRLKKGYGKYCSRKCANTVCIPAMNRAARKFIISKEELEYLYMEQRLSAQQIAPMFDISSEIPVYYWLKKYKIRARTNSEAHMGQTPWNKGKPRTKETKMKISQANNKQITRTCIYCGKTFRVPKCRLKNNWGKYCSQSCVAQDTGWKNLYNLSKRPTSIEQKLIQIIECHNLPIEYVGDGKIFINRRVPDFIVSSERKVIEVFGSYWHSPLLNPKMNPAATYDQTLDYYQKHGFDCLIIWDTELQNENMVLNKINDFLELR